LLIGLWGVGALGAAAEPPSATRLQDGSAPAAMDAFAQALAADPTDMEARRGLDLTGRRILETAQAVSFAPPTEVQSATRRAQEVLRRRSREMRAAMDTVRASYEPSGLTTRASLLRTCRGTDLQLRMALGNTPEDRLLKEDLHSTCVSLEKAGGDGPPAEAEALRVSGYLAYFQGEVGAALEKWDSALKLLPGDVTLKRVVVQTAAVLERDSRRVQVSETLARAEKKWAAHDEDGARRLYNEVLALEPNNSTARERAAVLKRRETRRAEIGKHRRAALDYTAKGQAAEAAREWLAVLEWDPVNAEATRHLSERRAQLLAAPPEQGASPRGDPRRAEERYALGLIHYAEGDLAGARRAFEECLSHDSRHPQARRALDRLRQQIP
jgi:tetratricopeptide (TPR) repeat protein